MIMTRGLPSQAVIALVNTVAVHSCCKGIITSAYCRRAKKNNAVQDLLLL